MSTLPGRRTGINPRAQQERPVASWSGLVDLGAQLAKGRSAFTREGGLWTTLFGPTLGPLFGDTQAGARFRDVVREQVRASPLQDVTRQVRAGRPIELVVRDLPATNPEAAQALAGLASQIEALGGFSAISGSGGDFKKSLRQAWKVATTGESVDPKRRIPTTAEVLQLLASAPVGPPTAESPPVPAAAPAPERGVPGGFAGTGPVDRLPSPTAGAEEAMSLVGDLVGGFTQAARELGPVALDWYREVKGQNMSPYIEAGVYGAGAGAGAGAIYNAAPVRRVASMPEVYNPERTWGDVFTDMPMVDIAPQGTERALSSLSSPYRRTAAGRAATRVFVLTNPVSGTLDWFGPYGKPRGWTRVTVRKARRCRSGGR